MVSYIDLETGKEKKRNNLHGYVGPPYFSDRTNGEVLVGNYPPSILVQETFQNFDARILLNVAETSNMTSKNTQIIFRKVLIMRLSHATCMSCKRCFE